MKAVNLAIPRTPNVTLVAFYQHKPSQLIALIEELQDYLSNHKLVKNFIPYELAQVHGTIIGCEGLKTEAGVINRWFYERRQEKRYIDLPGLIDYLQHQVDLPLNARFGGYDRNTQYNFLSRNQHPYVRSFQLNPTVNQAIPVLIGWLWENNAISLTMDNLRQDLQQFNLLHQYYKTADAVDNDFYLRLGTIDATLSFPEIEQIATDVRNLLAAKPPLEIPINLHNLAFAQYQDLVLTPAKTKIIPIKEATVTDLEKLYPNSSDIW